MWYQKISHQKLKMKILRIMAEADNAFDLIDKVMQTKGDLSDVDMESHLVEIQDEIEKLLGE